MVTKTTSKKVVKAPTVKTAAKPAKVTSKVTNVDCTDQHCHVHGRVKMRGRVFEGKVLNSKMIRTVTVGWPRKLYLSKYERFEKRRSKVKAHNPPCINAKVGDTVVIAECRPLSKTKNFVVLEVLNESN